MTSLVALLLILDFEAFAALFWAILTPSESGQGVFLSLSSSRLALAAILLLICLALLAATLRLLRSRDRLEPRLIALDDWIIEQRRFASALIPLSILPLVAAAGALAVYLTPLDYAAYKSWAPDSFPQLHSIVAALLPLLALFVLACLEITAFLVVRYWRLGFKRPLWSWDLLAPVLVALAMVIAVAFHWMVLLFQLRFFVNLPAWYWIFNPVRFGPGDVLYAFVALALVGLVYGLLMVRHRILATLVLVAILGWWLQMGVGLMGGDGLAYLADRYFSTYHRSYVEQASRSQGSLIDNVRRYEQLYTSSRFTNTKPPGVMAFYIALDRLVNGPPSTFTEPVRYLRLSDLVIGLFPVLAVCMVPLLYLFARRLLTDVPDLVPSLAPLLYVLAPGVALFTFFADQAVYPLAFLFGIWLSVSALRRRSLSSAFLLGAFLYLAVFFSFSLLPLYPFAALYLFLLWWQERSALSLRQSILAGLALAAGSAALYLLFRLTLNYDFFPRFAATVAINHNFDFYERVGLTPASGPETLPVRLSQILRAAWLNNLDYAAAIGFPLYILFVAQAARRIGRFFRGSSSPGDILLLALLGSFVVLNLAGTAQGEVPRLWLFWLPMLVLLAALELEPHLRRRPQLLLALALVQLITLGLTFHFQDLRM